MFVDETLPKAIIAKAIDLSDLGVNEKAWRIEDVDRVLKYAASRAWFVLGGDVVRLESGTWHHTYDSWHCERDVGENVRDFSLRSIAEATKYIASYPLLENVAFIVVLDASSSPN